MPRELPEVAMVWEKSSHPHKPFENLADEIGGYNWKILLEFRVTRHSPHDWNKVLVSIIRYDGNITYYRLREHTEGDSYYYFSTDSYSAAADAITAAYSHYQELEII